MRSSHSLLLAAAVVGAALFAAFHKESAFTSSTTSDPRPPDEAFDPAMVNGEGELPPGHPPIGNTAAQGQMPPGHPPVGNAGPQDEMPPGHPPIGATGGPEMPAAEGPAAIVWKAPAKWTSSPNPNAMRLATYHVPAAAGAADEAELTVVRAGGSTEANLDRWTKQFENPQGMERTTKTVHGLKVSTLEVQGVYQSTMAGGPPRTGWMLRAAVVETEQGPYFFKLTGPSASVRAARGDFDALLGSVAPAPSTP